MKPVPPETVMRSPWGPARCRPGGQSSGHQSTACLWLGWGKGRCASSGGRGDAPTHLPRQMQLPSVPKPADVRQAGLALLRAPAAPQLCSFPWPVNTSSRPRGTCQQAPSDDTPPARLLPWRLGKSTTVAVCRSERRAGEDSAGAGPSPRCLPSGGSDDSCHSAHTGPRPAEEHLGCLLQHPTLDLTEGGSSHMAQGRIGARQPGHAQEPKDLSDSQAQNTRKQPTEVLC